MRAKQLIELNNEKRKLLNTENEKYYSDMLLYLRLQFTLSEQQTEEILMELLDHLLEGQKEGKSAEDIFGSNPKAYADELIKLLPKEKKKEWLHFVLPLALNLISWILIIRGILVLIIQQFKEIDTFLYPIPLFLILLVIASGTIATVWFIFRTIEKSLFRNEERGKWRDTVLVGCVGALFAAIVIGSIYFIPDFGPGFSFPWLPSIITGCIIWLISYIYGKRIRS